MEEIISVLYRYRTTNCGTPNRYSELLEVRNDSYMKTSFATAGSLNQLLFASFEIRGSSYNYLLLSQPPADYRMLLTVLYYDFSIIL